MAVTPGAIALTQDDLGLLEVLQQKRMALTVSIGGQPGLYTSYLLAIEPGYLHIDELVPGDGAGQLQQGAELVLRARLGGVDYRFRSRYVSGHTDQRGFGLHRIEPPLALESSNRRSEHRLALRLTDAPICGLSTVGGRFVEGELEDISQGGACVRLDSGGAALESGGFVLLNVGFGHYGDLSCAGKVRYLKRANNQRDMLAGLSFNAIEPAASKQLRGILMGVQRHNIRTGLTS
tara:strand:- start:14659 stop:15363 length:705 start_codon:yes stop_codon:yes gene_type:complete